MVNHIFVPHAREIWTKSYGQNYTKFWLFWQKKKNRVFKNHFSKSVDAIFEDISVAEIIVLMINYYFEDYHLSVFQKLL